MRFFKAVHVSKGFVQFAQAMVAYGVTYVAQHYSGAHFTILGQAASVAALIGIAEYLASVFPALQPWIGSIGASSMVGKTSVAK